MMTGSVSLLFLFQLILASESLSCPTSNLPGERRVVGASIAVKAILTDIRPERLEAWILEAYRGGDKLTAALGVNRASTGLRDLHINITGLNECSAPEHSSLNQAYILLLRASGGRGLTLDSVVGSVIPYTEDLDRRILKLQGWELWSSWSACSLQCGGGSQSRSRKCIRKSCPGYDIERRVCNTFSCRGYKNLLHVENSKYFKPSRKAFHSVPERPGAWRMKAGSYLLYPYQEAVGSPFPRQFTLFVSFNPYNNSEGIIVSFSHPQHKDIILSLELYRLAGNNKLGLKLVHSTGNGTRIITIPAELTYNSWNSLAISIGEESTIKTYLDCRWVTTQIIHGHSLSVDPNTDLALGYLFQGELEQVTLTEDADDVSEQCSLAKLSLSSSTVEESKDDNYAESQTKSSNLLRSIFRPRNKAVAKAATTPLPRITSPARSTATTALSVGQGTNVGAPGQEQEEEGSAEGSGSIHSQDDDDSEEEEGSGSHLDLEWSSWSSCSATCGPATQTRWSRCADGAGMMECITQGREKRVTKTCKLPPCSVSGMEGARHITAADIARTRERIESGDRIGFAPSNTGSKDRDHVAPGQTGNKDRGSVAHSKTATRHHGKECGELICRNGGICLGVSKCSCPHGFSGLDCGDYTCSLHCLNGGVCLSSNSCTCPHGFSGYRCQNRICEEYEKVRIPRRRAFKRVISLSGEPSPVYRTFYRTDYKTVIRCKESGIP